jgi:hypothetical protein
MHNTQHNPRCRVYLHPAAANPITIAAIQASTGLVLIVNPKRRTAIAAPVNSPWGGDAA